VATHNNRRESGLIAAAAMVRWWPAALAFVALGVAYALVSDRLTVGPPWWPLVLAVLAVAGARALRWRGLIHATRYVVIPALTAVTIAVTISAGFLVDRLLRHTADPADLLSGGALVWFSNILTFALWYWELDGGGPAHRHATRRGSSDFAFPQAIVGRGESGTWMPEFVDYLFLAFNTSTAFSPTDTMVLARRAKIMMMCQSLVSLVAVLVLVARAINSL
jgi:hypothetical protein